MLGERAVTDQIFLHSKMMLVDDRVAIIGSNNINDRSLLGDRDSELAVVVTEEEEMMSSMAGRAYPVSRFAHSLRLRLMNEHTGLPLHDADTFADPLAEEALSLWQSIAARNQEIYE